VPLVSAAVIFCAQTYFGGLAHARVQTVREFLGACQRDYPSCVSFVSGFVAGVISGRPPKDRSGCRDDLTSEDITQAYLTASASGSPDALSLPNDSNLVVFLDFVYLSCF
jgi:hypothetical protein